MAMDAAGLPEGLFQNLVLSHDQTGRILGAGLVDHCNFTGSGRRRPRDRARRRRLASRRSASNSAARTRPMCGPMRTSTTRSRTSSTAPSSIPDNAAAASSGSMSTRRIYERFVDGLRRAGQANTCSAIRSTRRRRSARWRTSALPISCARRSPRPSRKARRRISMLRGFAADAGDTAYLAPQVLTGVDHSMSVMRDESFGPIVGIMKVARRRGGDPPHERLALWPLRRDLDIGRRGGRVASAIGSRPAPSS